MPFVVVDTETSGLFDYRRPADAPDQPRLASWCTIFVDDELNIQHEASALVRPAGWEMSADALRVNGLTTERLLTEGASILWPLSLYALAIDDGRTIVGHNVRFDAKVMRGELRRAGMADRYAETKLLCTMVAARKACGASKFISLGDSLRQIAGRELADAHDCVADARGCLDLLRALRDRHGLREAAIGHHISAVE